MGMYCQVYTLALSELERIAGALGTDPEAILKSTMSSSSSIQEVYLQQEIGKYLQSRADGSSTLSLEKAWHGLHFLLTGSPDEGEKPLNFLSPKGRQQTLGECQFFRPDEVRLIDQALSAVSEEQLFAHFNPQRMVAEEIYSFHEDEDEEGFREETLFYFSQLRTFVHEAAESGMILITEIS